MIQPTTCKPVLRRILVFALACWIGLAANPAIVRAEALPSVSDAEKILNARWVISEVMALILSDYVGDEVTAEDLYEAALRGMTSLLDPYSEYLSPNDLSQFMDSMSGRLTGIGVTIRGGGNEPVVVVRVLPDTPAKKAGILPGDIFVSVNGKAVSGYTSEEVVSWITDERTRMTALTVNRNGKTVSFNLRKEEIRSISVYTDSFKHIPETADVPDTDSYRYLHLSAISETAADDFKKALEAMKSEKVKGIVLDMRGNPGGYLDTAIEICNQVVPQGAIIHTVDKQGGRNTLYSHLTQLPFEKMVVLVDEFTASAAEVIAAALQDSNAAIIVSAGEATYGKGVIQTMYALETGGAIKMTTQEYFRRNGNPINLIGVTPDILLEKPESVKPYEDWVLAEALAILMSE